ncbi:hypothetical protein NPIL_548761, partial [Nephila pilipes]
CNRTSYAKIFVVEEISNNSSNNSVRFISNLYVTRYCFRLQSYNRV